MREKGCIVMKENSRTQIVAARLTPEEKGQLIEVCESRGITISEFIRELIEEELAKQNRLYGF